MINTKELFKRIEYLDKSTKEIAEELNIKEPTLINWITGKTALTLDKAEKMQKALKIVDNQFGFYFFQG